MEINTQEVQTYLGVLNNYGVKYTELRVFRKNGGGNLTKIVSTNPDDFPTIESWIVKNNLYKQTINCTFNKISDEAVKKSKPIKDSDIEQICFVFLDIDPERPTKISSTDQEKKNAESIISKIAIFLRDSGIDQQLLLDSGNGYHLLLPIESGDVLYVKQIAKQFLKAMDIKFSNDGAKCDVSVSNPSRLGKLIGCVANKGESTEERPHRVSKIISTPKNIGEPNRIKSFQNVINTVDGQMNKKNKKNQKNDSQSEAAYIFANVPKWLSYYPELKYSEKPGDYVGMTLYPFEVCPLAENGHTNSESGACISVTEDGKAKFRCLHASHKDLTIHDFAKKYPLPDTDKLNRSTNEAISIDGLKENYRYTYGQFQLSHNGVQMRTEKGGYISIGNCIFVKKIVKNIDTKEIEIDLCFFINGEMETITLGAEILQMNNFKQIVKYGYTFLSVHEKDIVDYLNLQKDSVTIEYEHSSIGWFLNETGGISYRVNGTFSESEERLSKLSQKSPFDLLPKIDAESQLDEFIKKNILNSSMELALCIGLAVIPHGFLKVSGQKDLANLMINLQGKSSTGKTAALKFVSSMFGNPASMVRNFNATNNAIIKLASQSSGIPLIFDELGAASSSDLSSLFYQLSLGEEKLRMTTGRELMGQERFSVITLMSSEEDVDSYLEKKLDGLLVRRVQFSDVPWTKSAKHAEKIKQFCTSNYGWIIEKVMDKLFPNNLGILKEYYEKSYQYLLPKLSEHRLKERICENLALIYTGGLLGVHVLGYPIDLKQVESYLVSAYKHLIEENPLSKQSTLERVYEILVQNAHRFVDSKGVLNKNSSPIYGKFSLSNDGIFKVNIFARVFEKLLKQEFNVKDVNYIIKELLEEGSMQNEKGRRTKRVRVNKQTMTTYELILPAELRGFFTNSVPHREFSSSSDVKEFLANNTKEIKDENLDF